MPIIYLCMVVDTSSTFPKFWWAYDGISARRILSQEPLPSSHISLPTNQQDSPGPNHHAKIDLLFSSFIIFSSKSNCYNFIKFHWPYSKHYHACCCVLGMREICEIFENIFLVTHVTVQPPQRIFHQTEWASFASAYFRFFRPILDYYRRQFAKSCASLLNLTRLRANRRCIHRPSSDANNSAHSSPEKANAKSAPSAYRDK